MKENNKSMRYLKLASILVCLMVMTSCGSEIHLRSTIYKKGLIYQKGSDKPFTGYVVGKGRDDYRRERMVFRKHYKNGRLNGNTQYWYGNGQLESMEPYKDGVINGVITRYYKNGQVKARIHLINGQRGGYKGEFFWYEDGRKKA